MVSLLAGALALLNALLVYVLFRVGKVVFDRRPEGGGSLAAKAFAMWWFTLAVFQAGAVADFALRGLGGQWSLAAYLAYVQLLIILLVAAFGALLYYMVFVFTGRREAWRPIAVLYAALYLMLVYYIALSDPIGVKEGALGTTLEYRHDLADSLLAQAIGIGLLLPTLLAAVGYLSLLFRVDDRSQRFRIIAVAGAFIIWFGSSLLVGQFTDWNDTAAWQVASALITLGSAVAVYTACQPPRWMRRRFHLTGFGEHH